MNLEFCPKLVRVILKGLGRFGLLLPGELPPTSVTGTDATLRKSDQLLYGTSFSTFVLQQDNKIFLTRLNDGSN